MKIKKLMIILIILMTGIRSDLNRYLHLEIKEVSSIDREDLPLEFGDGAFDVVDDFIKKTRNLNYEIVMYFDYVTGEILKCAIGDSNHVEMEFEEGEFEGYHVASIHNHPKNLLSPPSGLNFAIFTRDFEDYELIAGFENFWILKAKGVHETLISQMNIAAELFFNSALEECSCRYGDENIIEKMHDIKYGAQLLKFINNKNIKDIQLTKKEYVTMENNIKTASYNCRKRVTDPEEIRLARIRQEDPNILSGKDKVYAFYQMVGMDIEYDEIFSE